MVAITFDHPLQQAQMFLVDTHQTVLIDDQHTLAVADIEQGRSHGVMRGTIGIAADGLQLTDAPRLQGIGDSGSHAGMILMHVHALQFQRLTVKQEASFCVEGNLADADRGGIDIGHLVIHLDDVLYLIEVRIIGTPQMGILDHHHVQLPSRVLWVQIARMLILAIRHLLSLSIEQPDIYRIQLLLESAVGHLCPDRQNGIARFLLQVGPDECAEGRHTHLSRFLQPHIAIDASSFIEPALLERGISPYTDQIVATIIDIRGNVVYLRGIAAGLGAHIEAVEPHLRIAEDAVEAQHQSFAQILLAYLEDFTIPAHTGLGIFPAYGLIAVRMTCLSGVWQHRHPVVRNLYLLP